MADCEHVRARRLKKHLRNHIQLSRAIPGATNLMIVNDCCTIRKHTNTNPITTASFCNDFRFPNVSRVLQSAGRSALPTFGYVIYD